MVRSKGSYISGSAKPVGGGRFEVFQWYYFRLSGAVLTLLAFFHLWLNHIHTEVGTLDYDLVISRLRDFPVLRVVDFLLLFLGLSHGLLGVKNLIDDNARSASRRAFWLSLLVVLFTVFLVAGTAVLWTLDTSGGA